MGWFNLTMTDDCSAEIDADNLVDLFKKVTVFLERFDYDSSEIVSLIEFAESDDPIHQYWMCSTCGSEWSKPKKEWVRESFCLNCDQLRDMQLPVKAKELFKENKDMMFVKNSSPS